MSSVKYDFSGKVAVVTGGASGMGLAAAKAYAEAGASVVVSDVNQEALDKVIDEIISAGGTAIGVVCDVTDENQVEALIQKAVDTYGTIDMAYNNAGIQVPACSVTEETFENFEKVNAINLRGVWACMKHELRVMKEKGRGAIVNCSSTGGLVGLERLAAYHGSKHGVIGLTKSAAMEFADSGIRINAVCPGAIHTPMVTSMLEAGDLTEEIIASSQPIGRLGEAREIAEAVMWLSSDASSFVLGIALPVDGGFTAH